MFDKGMYCYVFYCLCCEIDISTDMSEDQVSEQRDLEKNEEEDIRMDENRDDNWRNVSEEGDYNKKIHDLRWELSVKDK